jgi:hypothetical protein
MITATLVINGVNYSQYIKYPVSYTDKNLDESLNILELSLFATPIDKPFKPNTVVDITIKNDNVDWFVGKMVISGDSVERVGVTNKYDHKMSFIELTHLLNLEVLPDMTITRVSVVNPDQIGSIYEPTLKDVVLKILKYSEGTFSKTLTLGAATANILDAIKSPELTLTRYTTLEALRLVFGIAKIVPYCLFEGFLNHISISSSTATIPNYIAQNEAYDANTFRTRLYSSVENFIGGGDLEGSIYEPQDGWMTPRSLGTTDIKNDAAGYKLSRPIYKIEDFLLKPAVVFGIWTAVDMKSFSFIACYVDIEELNPLWIGGPGGYSLVNLENPNTAAKITSPLYEKSVYEGLLPNTDTGKGRAFFYTQGKNLIEGFTDRPETWDQFWQPTKQAYRSILEFYGAQGKNSGIFIKPEYEAAFLTYMESRYIAIYGGGPIANPNKFYGFIADAFVGSKNSDGKLQYTKAYLDPIPAAEPFPITPLANLDIIVGGSTTSTTPQGAIQTTNVGDIQARVVYTPYINTKLFTYKERKETDDPTHITTTFYNQSANTVADDVLAELHDKVIKRGNAPTETIKMRYSNPNTTIPIGRRVADYIITARDMTISAEDVIVEYVLSKDYTKLNQYVAVLEKYRQFSIPSEQVVDRQITINEFAKFSRTTTTKTSALAVGSYMGTKEIGILLIDPNSTYKLPDNTATQFVREIMLPTTNFAFNNALVFEAQFQTNASAGGQSVVNPANPTTRRLERPYLYTDNTGYMQRFTTFKLVTDIASSMSLADSHELPAFINETPGTTHLTLTNVDVDKDARERLSMSYMLHHIDTTGKVFINRGWALRNGLIGGPGYTGLRFAFFNTRPREGVTQVSSYSPVGTYPAADITNDSSRITIKLLSGANASTANYWGIIDENNDLLFWVDEPVVAGTAPNWMYINFSNTY